MSRKTPKICVCGSINMDLVVRTPTLPMPGQTLLADSISEVSGGKGANQAVAAARLGADVLMIGRIGNDGFGKTLLETLEREGIDMGGVRSTPVSSGVAVVAVENSGENSIMVIPGANGELTPIDIDREQQRILDCDIVVAQLETPLETIRHLTALTRRLGKPLLLNTAPAPRMFPSELYAVTVLCPNRTEAETLLGTSLSSRSQIEEAAKELLARGPENVVITLGSEGAYWRNAKESRWLPPFAVRPVDTTAAGDAFIGALAFQWALGVPVEAAAEFACAAGALATTKHGAQPSMPTLVEVESLLQSQARL